MCNKMRKDKIMVVLVVLILIFYSTTVREGKYKFVQILKKDIRDIKLCTEIIIAVNEVGK